MKIEKIIEKYLLCWEEFIRLLKNGRLLLPFIVLALGQVILLLAIVYHLHFPFSYIMVGLIQKIAGEKALHYPNHFILLPLVYNFLSMPLLIVLGFSVFGWGVLMLADYYAGTLREINSYLRAIYWNIPAFISIGAVFVVSAVGIPFLFSEVAKNLQSPVLGKIFRIFSLLSGYAVESLLIYSLLFTKIYGDSAIGGVKQSVRFARKRFILTFMIIISMALIHKPLEYLLSLAGVLALKFNPENIVIIVLANIILEIFTNLFIFSSTTYLVLGRKKQ